MNLREMKINHAFRHFTEHEMMYYFQYNEKYFEALPNGIKYHKCFMTDGESVYIVHFDEHYNMIDKHFIASLKYIDAYEIQGNQAILH